MNRHSDEEVMDNQLHSISVERFEETQQLLEDDFGVQDLAERFKALCDPTRLRIVLALKAQELCVHDLAQLIDTSESNASHQLRLLRNAKIVKYRKKGKRSFYSIDDEHITHIIEDMQSHLNE